MKRFALLLLLLGGCSSNPTPQPAAAPKPAAKVALIAPLPIPVAIAPIKAAAMVRPPNTNPPPPLVHLFRVSTDHPGHLLLSNDLHSWGDGGYIETNIMITNSQPQQFIRGEVRAGVGWDMIAGNFTARIYQGANPNVYLRSFEVGVTNHFAIPAYLGSNYIAACWEIGGTNEGPLADPVIFYAAPMTLRIVIPAGQQP